MLANGCIAIYHFNEKMGVWKRSFYPSVSIFRRFSSSASAGDFSPENHCVIRIPNYANADICIGDYVYIGNSTAAAPDLKLCLKVTSFVRNHKGLSPHLKIICS